MLVLSRQRDQAIVIGDEIEVTVVDIRGDKVRLGVNAPRSVTVHRKEIYDAIKEENRAAAEIKPGDVAPLVDSPSSIKLATDRTDIGDPFMHAAKEEARKSAAHGGVPIGAVLARAGRVIARGHNRSIQRADPLAHAELDCISSAGRQKTYADTTLYTTLMPCLVSASAIAQLGIPRLIVADTSNFDGGRCKATRSAQLLRDCGVEVIAAQDGECVEMLAAFAREKPEAWKEMEGA